MCVLDDDDTRLELDIWTITIILLAIIRFVWRDDEIFELGFLLR